MADPWESDIIHFDTTFKIITPIPKQRVGELIQALINHYIELYKKVIDKNF